MNRLDTDALRALVDDLALTQPPATDTELIDQVEALERVKSAACALQATLTAGLATLRPTSTGKPQASVSNEIALARRESPHVGQRKTTLALALAHDLPTTHLALARGDLNENRAQIIADETAQLSHDDRLKADAEITKVLDGLGDKALTNKIRRIVLMLDEDAALKRRRKAMANRHLTGRDLGDGTAKITAIVPDIMLPTIMGSLDKAAASCRAAGDERTRAQLTVDIAAARLAGLTDADAANGKSQPPVAVQLLVSAETLLGDDSTPGHLAGHGPIPASVARHLVATCEATRSTLRRVFAMPQDGSLVTMESAQRLFPPDLRAFIKLRDDTCRNPYCNSPVRHVDHAEPASRGGQTSVGNGQGVCEWCNYTKDHPGWRHQPGPPDRPHEVTVTTPTGHTYVSREPGAPMPPPRRPSMVEAHFLECMLIA
ncbi:HNH endonuclease [Nocardioides jensenii]|uniref:HNH endonuclease n=1 Tax=Nocardioides jensenii TaxID=1843 RepID=UPI000831D35A|nr:HNH endonuclease signature motif containing protein [Nocardioides jensenii]